MACPTLAADSRPSSARVYRPRRPAKTLLHQITRENLETYLADLDQGEDFSAQAPLHVEAAFREYLKCGLLCHGFARAYCAGCGHDFLVALACYSYCTSSALADTATDFSDDFLSGLAYRYCPISSSFSLGRRPLARLRLTVDLDTPSFSSISLSVSSPRSRSRSYRLFKSW